MKLDIIISVIVFWIFYSCDFVSPKNKTEIFYKKYEISPDSIMYSIDNWLTYTTNYLDLSEDFIGLDEDSNRISKQTFLNILSSRKYLPVKLYSQDSSTISFYQLLSIKKSDSVIEIIKSDIETLADQAMFDAKLKGTAFPCFNFIDVNNNSYNNESTANHYIVVDCWFVNCTSCVYSIPTLNMLKQKYSRNKNISFIALSTDSKEKVKYFLKTHKFDFSIIPNKNTFVSDSLSVKIFPTYFVINKRGFILQITHNVSSLSKYLALISKKFNEK